MRYVLPLAIGMILAGLLVVAARAQRQRRRRRDLPEINRHPERLEQMLDPSDDA